MTLRPFAAKSFFRRETVIQMKKLAILILCALTLLCSCSDLSALKNKPKDTTPPPVTEGTHYRVDRRDDRYYLTIIESDGTEHPYMYFNSVPEITEIASGILLVDDGSKVIFFDPDSKRVSDDLMPDDLLAYNDKFYVIYDSSGIGVYSMSDVAARIDADLSAEIKGYGKDAVKAEFSADSKTLILTYVSAETGEQVTDNIPLQ